MSPTTHLIFNPVSGQGDAELELAQIKASLSNAFNLVVHETKPDISATDLAHQALEAGADLVIASGGDGTVSAVAAVLTNTEVPLSIIPRGTANAIATAMSIPTDLHDACGVVTSGECHAIDIASCNDLPMVLLAGVGLEATVIEQVSRARKNSMGTWAYLIAGVQQLRDIPTFEAVIETREKTISVQASAITVANLAPSTSILAQGPAQVIADDGLLDITIFSPQGLGDAIAASYELFRSALSEEATQRDDIGFLRSSYVKISTEPDQKVVIDGEIVGELPLEIRCIPRGLKLLVPPEALPAEVESLEGLPGLTIEEKEIPEVQGADKTADSSQS